MESTVTDVAPSGKATSAKEDDIGENKLEEKDKEKNWEGEKEKEVKTETSASAQSSEKKGEESGREPIAQTTLLAITTANAKQKSITEMSSTKLMMIAAHKMIKEGTKEKQIIDHSIPILLQLVLECQINKGASPSNKLKMLTKHISKEFQSL